MERKQAVTLEKLSETFYLSKPYLWKYIKESTNTTFGDIVKQNIYTGNANNP